MDGHLKTLNNLVSMCLILKMTVKYIKSWTFITVKQLAALYFERSVDVVVGGDGRVLSGLPEAPQRWRLHIDDVSL